MRVLKIISAFLLFLLIAGFITIKILDEPLPEGQEGFEAEKLADKMLTALNKQAWDSIEMVEWSYPPNHHFIWYKTKDSVIVEWADKKVYLNTLSVTGKVVSDEVIDQSESTEIIKDAHSYFINDSFWLIAPYKVFDSGTVRKLVKYEDSDALLVTYTSGGLTPGDSYLWILDKDGKPIAWKFWVRILPIGGIEFSWDNWKNINGALISTLHEGIIDLEITNLEAR